MNCEKCRELLSEYIDGRLDVEDSAAVAAHLEDCAECRALERELRATVAMLGGLEEQKPPSDFSQRIAERLERRMLIEEAPAKGRRLMPWSMAGVGLAAAAAVLAAFYILHAPQSPRDAANFADDRGSVSSAPTEGEGMPRSIDMLYSAPTEEPKDAASASQESLLNRETARARRGEREPGRETAGVISDISGKADEKLAVDHNLQWAGTNGEAKAPDGKALDKLRSLGYLGGGVQNAPAAGQDGAAWLKDDAEGRARAAGEGPATVEWKAEGSELRRPEAAKGTGATEGGKAGAFYGYGDGVLKEAESGSDPGETAPPEGGVAARRFAGTPAVEVGQPVPAGTERANIEEPVVGEEGVRGMRLEFGDRAPAATATIVLSARDRAGGMPEFALESPQSAILSSYRFISALRAQGETGGLTTASAPGQAAGRSNLKQIGLAMGTYQVEYDEFLGVGAEGPLTVETLRNAAAKAGVFIVSAEDGRVVLQLELEPVKAQALYEGLLKKGMSPPVKTVDTPLKIVTAGAAVSTEEEAPAPGEVPPPTPERPPGEPAVTEADADAAAAAEAEAVKKTATRFIFLRRLESEPPAVEAP